MLEGLADGPRFIEVEVEGARIEARVLPPAGESGTWLVFLHQGLGSTSTWRDFPDRVARATGLGTIVYSRLGYGDSDPRPIPWPADFMEEEARVYLPGVLDALEVRDVILVGHSDGASIALIYASEQPSGLRGVVALAPHVNVEDQNIDSIQALPAVYRNDGLRDRLAPHHGPQLDDTFSGWTEVWLSPAFRSWNIESALENITAPLLVIQGEADPYGSLAQVEAIRARAAAVETLLLEGCGHEPHRDEPERTIDAVLSFSKRVGSRG